MDTRRKVANVRERQHHPTIEEGRERRFCTRSRPSPVASSTRSCQQTLLKLCPPLLLLVVLVVSGSEAYSSEEVSSVRVGSQGRFIRSRSFRPILFLRIPNSFIICRGRSERASIPPPADLVPPPCLPDEDSDGWELVSEPSPARAGHFFFSFPPQKKSKKLERSLGRRCENKIRSFFRRRYGRAFSRAEGRFSCAPTWESIRGSSRRCEYRGRFASCLPSSHFRISPRGRRCRATCAGLTALHFYALVLALPT